MATTMPAQGEGEPAGAVNLDGELPQRSAGSGMRDGPGRPFQAGLCLLVQGRPLYMGEGSVYN